MENENANPHLYDAREQQERIAFLERPLAFDAGRKRPLLLGDDLIGGSDDDGVDFVSAALGEILESLGKVKEQIESVQWVEVDTESTSYEELRSIHGLDAEAELANILSAEIAAELKEMRANNLAKAWQAVIDNPSQQNLQTLKWYFGEANLPKARLEVAYQIGGTQVTMEIDGWVFTTNFERPVDDFRGSVELRTDGVMKDRGYIIGSIEDKAKWSQSPVVSTAEIDIHVSPGICVHEPCGWIEKWDRAVGDETHEQYHQRYNLKPHEDGEVWIS